MRDVAPLATLTEKQQRNVAKFLKRKRRSIALVVPAPEPEAPAPDVVAPLADASVLTLQDETNELPQSRRLEAGANVSLDDTRPGKLVISAHPGMFAGGGSRGGASTWDQLTGKPDTLAMSQYLVQEESERHWTADEFLQGTNIIGVRTAAAVVYLPLSLPAGRVISVKDETGGGCQVRAYSGAAP